MCTNLWIEQPCQPSQNVHCLGVLDMVQEAVDEDEVETTVTFAGVSTHVGRQEPAAISTAGVREARLIDVKAQIVCCSK